MMKMIKKYTLLICIGFAVIMSGCGSNKNVSPGLIDGRGYTSYTRKHAEEETEDVKDIKKFDKTKTAVLLKVDKKKKRVVIKEINKDEKMYLNYTGSTDVADKFDQPLSIVQLKSGEIVDVYYDSSSQRLVKIEASKGAWEYTGIKNLKIDDENNIMTIGKEQYTFTDNLFVTSNGKEIDVMEICSVDIVTAKGVGQRIDSIIVTRGHGYVELLNSDYFIGGMIEFGSEVITLIEKNMLLVVPEGTYKVTATKGRVGGSTELEIKRDAQVSIDISEFQDEAVRFGTVEFVIEPEGAILYVDGKKTDYSELVDLAYGMHTINVTCEGYKDYKQTIVIDDIFIEKKIKLNLAGDGDQKETTEAPSEGETDDNDDIPVPRPTTGVTSDIYKIYVDEPKGAEVYFNGSHVGTAPVSFPKTSGSHTIVFTMKGYENKSYNVDIANDNEDVRFKFPDMLKKN